MGIPIKGISVAKSIGHVYPFGGSWAPLLFRGRVPKIHFIEKREATPMLSYQTYKMVHYLGFMLLFIGIGSVITSTLLGHLLQGTARRVAFMAHGLGMFFILLGGFGMLARLQLDGIPAWIYVKLGVWTVMGFSIALARRVSSIALLVGIVLIALIAPYMAIFKPF
jgi:hypothetical protein